LNALNSRDSVVGNAELLLILEGTRIPVLDTELPNDGSVETFLKYGLVAMENPLDDTDQLQELAVKRIELLYTEMATKGGQKYKEIMQCDENRFDLRLHLDLASSVGSSGWKNIEAKGRWLPLVEKILGTGYSLVKCGCVHSLPGTGVQYWHSDGVHNGASANFGSNNAAPMHALCVFVLLIDLDMSTGFTEFWAGSHKYSKLLAKKANRPYEVV
jgi:ectoine hydroxylase-related dioxygenase (phytanoyl-CoA dioxygenase family)